MLMDGVGFMTLKCPLHPKPFHGSMIITTGYPIPHGASWKVIWARKKRKKGGSFRQPAAAERCHGEQAGLVAPLGACGREKGRFQTGEAKMKGERGEGKEEEGKRQQMTLHLAQRNQDVKNNINQVTEG